MPANLTTIRPANQNDVSLILSFIHGLAEYEELAHEVIATETDLRHSLFGDQPAAEVLIAEHGGQAVGFALFFNNYSTFLAQAGIYLEDLFVLPEYRGLGVGKALLSFLAGLAVERRMGRLDWSVLKSNQPAIEFYQQLGACGLTDWMQYRLDGEALLKLGTSTPGR